MASKRGLDGEHLLTDESNGKRAKADLNGDSSHLDADGVKGDELDEGEEEEGDFNDEEEEADVIEEGEDGTPQYMSSFLKLSRNQSLFLSPTILTKTSQTS